MINLTKDNFQGYVGEGFTLVEFGAQTCAPCRALVPILEMLSIERPDIKFGKVDLLVEEDLAIAYNITTMPTLILFKDGHIYGRETRYRTREEILTLLPVSSNG